MVNSDGALWRKRRKMFNPVFHQIELKESVSILNKNAATLVKKLKMVSNESSIDILKFLHPCTLLNNFGKQASFFQRYCIKLSFHEPC